MRYSINCDRYNVDTKKKCNKSGESLIKLIKCILKSEDPNVIEFKV